VVDENIKAIVCIELEAPVLVACDQVPIAAVISSKRRERFVLIVDVHAEALQGDLGPDYGASSFN
jgi:hypothetical protein